MAETLSNVKGILAALGRLQGTHAGNSLETERDKQDGVIREEMDQALEILA